MVELNHLWHADGQLIIRKKYHLNLKKKYKMIMVLDGFLAVLR